MNFYKSQDEARKKTKLLVYYYIFAILGVIAAIYSALALVKMHHMPDYETVAGETRAVKEFWDLNFFLIVAGVTSLIILCGSLYKTMQLSSGGGAVAQSLGGRPVDPSTGDPEERQLMNVVEEMAIASGVPVPQVWIMDDEDGINAFAAGTEPGNAAIGVTKGTLLRLNRSELQGVVGHEFSHILNGDMKLNIRLLCMLHGLLLISIIGSGLIRVAFCTSSSRSREGNGIQAALGIVGIIFLVTGSVGAFFGSMIQAAISRQREYLADASAVEFTMDPQGLVGALRKIGGASSRSKVHAAAASEVQHMFFSEAGLFSYGFASHPPLDERIELIDADWDGTYLESSTRSIRESGQMQPKNVQQNAFGDLMNPETIIAAGVMESLGESSNTNIQKGQQIMAGLDSSWISATHDKYQSQLLVFGMLLAMDGELRDLEISHLKSVLGEELAEISLQWQGLLVEAHSSQKIALIDMCIPTLRRLSTEEYGTFIETTKWLIESDESVDLFEFMLQKVLQRHLDAHFVGPRKVSVKFQSIQALAAEVNVVVSTMCGIGAVNESDMNEAYASAAKTLAEHGCQGLQLLPPQLCGLDKIDEAVAKIEQATPIVKKQILHVCGTAVMHDGEVTCQEAELLRAIADAIGCSVPPFVKI